MFWGYDEFLLHVVGGLKGNGKFRVAASWIPFHLEQRELTVAFLDIVNLLLCGGAPEITVGIPAGILVCLDSFAYYEILPQGSCILTE